MQTDLASELAHHFLLAMPNMGDPNFDGSLVYIAEHSAQGAMGLVVNRPMELDIGTLLERIELDGGSTPHARTRVLQGGPVEPERGFVLHQPRGNWGATIPVADSLGVTSSRDILEAVAREEGPAQLLVTLGYSGWGPGQLEDELANNAWLTVRADPSVLFDTPVDERLARAFALLGIDPSHLSGTAGHA